MSAAPAIRSPARDLPDSQALGDFLATVPPLSSADRYQLVTQARTLLEGVYVHLALKRSMHAVDPVQRLRLLERRLDAVSDLQFHQELTGVFRSLGDLHTLYELPVPYRGNVATLGLLVERCAGKDGPRHVVTRVDPALAAHGLVPGADVEAWNGVPVARAVELHAEHGGGSNPAARIARGIESLTLRSMRANPPPDEREVLVDYRAPGARGRRGRQLLPWRVQTAETFAGRAQDPVSPASALHAIDPAAEATRQIKRTRFGSGRSGPARALDSVVSSSSHTIGGRRIGYLRIYSFNVSSARVFAEQLAKILAKLPAGGLVVDIRGNPGGHVPAAETLVQLLSRDDTTPASFSLTTTPLALTLCRANPQLKPWVDSIADAVETGEAYSQGFALSAPRELAEGLPRYAGPKVLVVDARSYSAADIFAAGWQDNGLGPILGTAERTGAGGANVWTHELLKLWLPDQLGALPLGAGFRVALRRATRTGANVGVPLEDLGVRADEVHEPTFQDITGSNEDLLAAAAALLPPPG